MALLEVTKMARGRPPKWEPNEIDNMLKGVFAWVHKAELTVPIEQYQRDRTEGALAKSIALNWNWIAYGVLIVILRKDRTHVVADGGARLRAAQLREDVRELPCMLYEVEDEKQEAEAFRLINMWREKLKVAELHKAELFEGLDQAVATENYLNRLASYGIGFHSLGDLRRKLNRRMSPHTWRMMEVFRELAANRYLSSRIFKGIITTEYMLSKRGESLLDKVYFNRLKKHGLSGLDAAITALMPTRGQHGGASLYSMAVCNLLKIKMD